MKYHYFFRCLDRETMKIIPDRMVLITLSINSLETAVEELRQGLCGQYGRSPYTVETGRYVYGQ